MEHSLNKKLIEALATLHAFRVENCCLPGTPDISTSIGWIESKWKDNWPKEGIVKLDHYTPQQRVWAIKQTRAKGPCWLMLQVKHDYLLFEGSTAATILGKVEENILRGQAILTNRASLDYTELLSILKQNAKKQRDQC